MATTFEHRTADQFFFSLRGLALKKSMPCAHDHSMKVQRKFYRRIILIWGNDIFVLFKIGFLNNSFNFNTILISFFSEKPSPYNVSKGIIISFFSNWAT